MAKARKRYPSERPASAGVRRTKAKGGAPTPSPIPGAKPKKRSK
jgi:hypothetical protein